MIDLHCHILPGVDDGAPDLDASLAMARHAEGAGIATIAATPHIREDFALELSSLAERVAELNSRLEAAGIAVRVVQGGELAISKAPDLDDGELAAIRLGDGPYVLVESPYADVGDMLESTLFELQVRDVQPLLAHPERSPCFLGDIGRVEALVERGIMCSVTAASMAGAFGSTVKAFTRELFAAGLVHDVASDAHDDRRRAPDLRPGFEGLDRDLPGLLAQAGWYANAAPRAIVQGADIPERPAVPQPRGLGRLVRGLRPRRGR